MKLNGQGVVVDRRKLKANQTYAISVFLKAMKEIDYDSIRNEMDLIWYCGLERNDVSNEIYISLVDARAEYYERKGEN